MGSKLTFPSLTDIHYINYECPLLDAASRAAELNIDVRSETKILKIDTARKRLTTAKGGIEDGKLILALDAHQRELTIEGDAAESVMRAYDLSSFKNLQQSLSQAKYNQVHTGLLFRK